MNKVATLSLLIAAAWSVESANAQTAPTRPLRYTVPSTVSPEAARQLQPLYDMLGKRPPATRPVTMADWDRQNAQGNALLEPRQKAFAQQLGVTTSQDVVGGVPVLRVRPAGWRPTGRTLLYLHGGGYVLFSPTATLGVPAQMAATSGDEVVSIDYTLAPHAQWRQVTDQVLAVWRALLASGASPASLGLFGDSAGGGLAAGAVLKMRDEGLPLPGALYLLSPWADITATGDTYTTLAAADPALDAERLAWGADIYADPRDQKNPYVSPVYGDYAKAFPPTLIQVGTREIFLSNAVREYQAIRSGGAEAVLDVYEGMPHVHPALAPGSPEAKLAIRRGADFFHAHLASGRRR